MTHRKAVNVKRRTAIGICAILVSLLLAGCSEDDEGRYGKPPTASPTQRTGTPSPTGPVSDEQAILAQYRKFWEKILPAASAAQSSQRKGILADYVMEPEISVLLKNMSRQDKAGARGYGADVPIRQSVERDAKVALVRGCLDSSNSGILDVRTGRKITRGPSRNPVQVNLQLMSDDVWRVSHVAYTGEAQC